MNDAMQIDIVFIVMLLIHILVDFYFQSDDLAEKKAHSLRAMLKHAAIYFVCSFSIFAFLPLSKDSVFLALGIGLSHAAVDLIKFFITPRLVRCKEKTADEDTACTDWIFFLDQLAHLVCLLLLWSFFGRNITPYAYVTQRIAHLPFLPITILLGFLLILKPASLIITRSGLLKTINSSEEDSVSSGNGEKIGYLERLIIFGLMMYGEFSAIGFVIAAKSITRFSEAKKDKQMAEYYIVGTLLSVVTAVIITIALGLCPIP